MTRRTRGITVIELMVVLFMSVLVLTAIVSVYLMSRQADSTATASYQLTQGLESAVRMLRADLRDTSLASVAIWAPAGQNVDTAPGLSMLSPRSVPQTPQLQLTVFGTVQWNSYVYYTLEKTGDVARTGNLQTGTLIRWTKALPSPTPIKSTSSPTPGPPVVPAPSSVTPSSLLSSASPVLKNVVLPNTSLSGAFANSGPQGGFTVSFVRRDPSTDLESLSLINPSQARDDGSGPFTTNANTLLVEVTLQVLAFNEETNQPSYFTQSMRFMPRN